MALETKTCILTGANGFVGSRLKRHLERNGWRVIAWTRQPEPGSGAVAFRLGQEVDPDQLKDAQALVHCAYDFGPRRRADIAAVNVAGSQKLLRAAQEAGVRSVVLISTLSAFAGCRSLYGQAKLEIEALARSIGAFVIRPGLVYSDNPGGMFGRLVRQVRGARFVPIIWGGRQAQYLGPRRRPGRCSPGLFGWPGRGPERADLRRPRARMGIEGDSGPDRAGAGQAALPSCPCRGNWPGWA